MRIGIVSDIHCNAKGLQTAIDRMGQVDELFCAGDAITEYRFDNEVVELLRARQAHMVKGNHEMVLLGQHGAQARGAAHVRKESLDYLAEQPLRIDITIGGRRILMVHANPLTPHYTYIYPDSPELARLSELDADYVILGHTHCQFAQRVGKSLVINPGSTGDARDHFNGLALSYAVLDLSSGEVTFDNYHLGQD